MFQRTRPAPEPGAALALDSPPPARRFTDGVPACGTVLGRGLNLRGSLTGAESVEVAGQFEGRIDVEGFCHIRKGARVVGPVTAADVLIEGELQGRLTVRGRVEMRASATVCADVEARTVAIADGCFFDGTIHMTGGDGGPSGPTTFREKRRARPPAPPQAPAQKAPGPTT